MVLRVPDIFVKDLDEVKYFEKFCTIMDLSPQIFCGDFEGLDTFVYTALAILCVDHYALTLWL